MNDINKKILTDRLAVNLPTFRTKLGISQDELAVAIGISKYTILSIEKGQRNMAWTTFLSLILLFSKNPDTNGLLTHFNINTDDLEQSLFLQKSR